MLCLITQSLRPDNGDRSDWLALAKKQPDVSGAALQHGLHEGTNQWMGDVVGGRAFGLEQGEHIERMRSEFEGAGLSIVI